MAESATPEVGRRSSRRPRAQATERPHSTPFPELAHLHHLWRHALDKDLPDLKKREEEYQEARAAFEDEHGPIISEYWCWFVPSAVALTEKPRKKVDSWFRRPFLAFHRASDWATRDLPDVAQQMHRCDELAIRATAVLSGVRRVICLRLVMSSAAHLLSFADAMAGREPTEDVVADEEQTLDETEKYFRDAANGQAQIIYFGGMAGAAAALGLLALFGSLWIPLPGVDPPDGFWASIAAGALGAVVSVIQRINSGQFALTYDVGRPYVTFLGALRPVLGTAFGLMLYFAITSGLLEIFSVPEGATEELFFFVVVAFLAGFNERWAQDTLTALGQGSGMTDPASPPPSGGGRRSTPSKTEKTEKTE